MYKYPSIEQFRNCIKEVQRLYKDKPLPILTFTGSVKLHGTNAGVELPANIPQSRNQVLSENNDNYGFYPFHKERKEIFQQIYDSLGLDLPIVIYGEWAGKGIQQNVAISKLNKAFYIFGIKVITGEDTHYWLKDFEIINYEERIFTVQSFGIWTLAIDFNYPELIQNKLQEFTIQVEQECPIANWFGVSGIGEGIVWEYIDDEGQILSFKVKGEKHSSSKVKVLAAIDTEKVKSIKEFVDTVLTDTRLEQAYFECNNTTDMIGIGLFLKWINTDIFKEESDTLEVSGLTIKDVGSAISKQAKQWYMEKIK